MLKKLTLADQAERAIRAVREAKEIAYDTETSGLDWKKNYPVGYVITVDRDNNFYIPVRHGGGGNLADPHCAPLDSADAVGPLVTHQFEEELARAFADRTRLGYITIGHNVKFDAHFSANAGIMLGRHLRDTSLRQAIIDEYTPSFSLAGCAKMHGVTPKLGDELYKLLSSRFGGQADQKAMGNYWKIEGNNPIAVDYACGDGITTLELWHAQSLRIEEAELGVIDDLEQNLIWTVFKMERRGMRVDPERLAATIEEVERQVEDAKLTLPVGYNDRSNPQTHKIMVEAGHTDWPKTPKGNPSFTEKWLMGNELGRAIVAKRKLTNVLSKFLVPVRDRHMTPQHRVHATLNQLKGDEYGTITGRFSCNDPNLQQVSKRDRVIAKIVRSIYIADDGYDFYEGDYSQCEPRLFAHYSQEPALVNGYCSEPFVDVHSVVAVMLGVERDPTAKRMNMGIFTGMFPEAFAGHMGWDLDRATNAWNRWFEAFPAIKDFQDLAKKVMKNRGYVKTILGRRCRMDHPRFAYRATSRIIQGGNADILKKKLLEADLYCESVGEDIIHLLMTVHDSFNWQESKDTGDRHSKELVTLLEDVQGPPFNLIVPFVVDLKKGRNWSIATFGEGK